MFKKKIAAEIMKCGVSRVRVLDKKSLEEALTRQDIRNLIRKKVIIKVQRKGTTRAAAKIILRQKKKGRRSGHGKRKGTYKTRNPKKQVWIGTIRPLRKLLKDLKKNKQIEQSDYKMLYFRAKGGAFRSKKQLLNYLKEREILKPRPKKGKLAQKNKQ